MVESSAGYEANYSILLLHKFDWQIPFLFIESHIFFSQKVYSVNFILVTKSKSPHRIRW